MSRNSGEETLLRTLQQVFGHDQFQGQQRSICEAVVRGDNALVVMPTGAGKSLCYQLPGIVRGGPTLVISPLIALMEDQVEQLRGHGLNAATLHAGTDRQLARQACREYVEGRLQFLFVAPERLRLPRFVQFLERYQPALIAVDEAHCISQWGHDFRPDYRLLKERLRALSKTPVVALTATANPAVVEDIVERLGVPDVRRFISGFRRDNLAIEVLQVAVDGRMELAQRILGSAGRLPAIVYAPTRLAVEQHAQELSRFGAEAYHAGLPSGVRSEVQRRFLRGQTDVIVATVAFGMGINKANVRTVIHGALPGSVEGYYQEIGRAGRDGQAARAVLLCGPSDLKTHQYFFERDYPEPSTVAHVYELLEDFDGAKEALIRRSGLEAAQFEKCLEKLVTFGSEDADPTSPRRNANWLGDYQRQREQKQAQLDAMVAFSVGSGCRMLALLAHFGQTDTRPCGLCDNCRPKETLASRKLSASPRQAEHMQLILGALQSRDEQATGRLYKATLEGQLPRRRFEELLSELERCEYLELSEHDFEKEGKTIRFQRARLTAAGRSASLADLRQTSPRAIASTPRGRFRGGKGPRRV